MQALRSTPSFADLRQSSTQHVLRTQRARPRIERPNTDDFELLGLAYSRLQQDAHSNEPTPSRTQHPSEERLLIHEDSRNASAELEHNQSDESGPCNTSTAGSCTTFLREIWLQLLWIHGSMLLVIITLVLIIVIFRVSSERSLFLEPTGWSYKKNKGILLINIPASKTLRHALFIANCTDSMADICDCESFTICSFAYSTTDGIVDMVCSASSC